MKLKKTVNNINLKNQLVNYFTIFNDQKILYIGTETKCILIYNIESGKKIKSFIAHSDSVSFLSINYQKNILASGGCDNSVRIWDLKNFRCI